MKPKSSPHIVGKALRLLVGTSRGHREQRGECVRALSPGKDSSSIALYALIRQYSKLWASGLRFLSTSQDDPSAGAFQHALGPTHTHAIVRQPHSHVVEPVTPEVKAGLVAYPFNIFLHFSNSHR